jgi:hypothetical protein
MKPLLMHLDRDFELPPPPPRRGAHPGWDLEPLPPWRRYATRRDPDVERQQLRPHDRALIQDLELDSLLRAMAGDDDFLFDVGRHALLAGPQNDVDTILYRQGILNDCLQNPAVIGDLYTLTVEVIERSRKYYISGLSRYAESILYESVEALHMLSAMLRKLRDIAAAQAGRFQSRGFTALFTMLQEELSDEYFARIQNHLTELKFRRGVSVSAGLGMGNEGTNYVLRRAPDDRRNWLERLLGKGPAAYTFYIDPRDEAGARCLSELRDRGIHLVANALAQSADHILSFFGILRTELAFYIGCLNLHEKLAALAAPVCFPQPAAAGGRRQRCSGLYDVCLALNMRRSVVGNALDGDGKSLVIITGANQGGKSTFLRGIGLAQMMMQCGMFVPAESFTAELCAGVFTHYKREEDVTMKHGKLDEELARMSEIADAITPNAIVLFNESFASTNEREGSEIARQVVAALLEKGVKVFFVTHLYEFARSTFERNGANAVFLRAERLADGTRTFRLPEGEPLETSYGEDLYKEVFDVETGELSLARAAVNDRQ